MSSLMTLGSLCAYFCVRMWDLLVFFFCYFKQMANLDVQNRFQAAFRVCFETVFKSFAQNFAK